MSRARTHKPYLIQFSRERHEDSPWTLAVELTRFTGRGRETARHPFDEGDLHHLRLALVLLDADNKALNDKKKTVNPKG